MLFKMMRVVVVMSAFASSVGGCTKTHPPGAKPTTPSKTTRQPPVTSTTQPIRVLSYNVLYDRNQWTFRQQALFHVIEQSDADLMAFQEVSPWFIKGLKQRAWSKAYHFSTHRAEGAPGGLLVLSKWPIEATTVLNIPSVQGRKALSVRVKLPHQRQLEMINVHLDSFLKDGPSRARQIQAIQTHLGQRRPVMVLGDFNFGDGEQPETGALWATWRDPWLSLHPQRVGWTWDRKKSPMADKGSFPKEPSRRLDRILIADTSGDGSSNKTWTPTSAQIVGDSPVPGQTIVFPSDHFGLIAQFDVRINKTRETK